MLVYVMVLVCIVRGVVPDLSTTEHIERTLTSKLQEVKGAITEQWKQLQVNGCMCIHNIAFLEIQFTIP